MSDPATLSVTPWWMAGSAIAGAIVLKVIEWFLGRRRDSAAESVALAQARGEVTLVDALKARVTTLEARQAELEHRLTREMELRLRAQEEVTRLRLRVLQLEAVLRAHRIEVPADLFAWADAAPDPEPADAQ